MSIKNEDFVKVKLMNDYFLPFINIGHLSLEELEMIKLWVPEHFLLKRTYSEEDIISLYEKHLGFEWVSLMLERMELDVLTKQVNVH